MQLAILGLSLVPPGEAAQSRGRNEGLEGRRCKPHCSCMAKSLGTVTLGAFPPGGSQPPRAKGTGDGYGLVLDDEEIRGELVRVDGLQAELLARYAARSPLPSSRTPLGTKANPVRSLTRDRTTKEPRAERDFLRWS